MAGFDSGVVGVEVREMRNRLKKKASYTMGGNILVVVVGHFQ